MRENYNSYKYWDLMINKNKTIRGHMFMDHPPKSSSLYIHSLIFSKKNGLDNVFAYFPEPKILLGYLQYSFLQEAFYKWINGKDSFITKIPSLTVERIINDGVNNNKINIRDEKIMKNYYNRLNNMWNLPNDKLIHELVKYAKDFNRIWYGSNEKFLYLKIMTSSEELGEFVVSSALIVGNEEDFKTKIGVDISEWRIICKQATKNQSIGERFKTILQKNLTEII